MGTHKIYKGSCSFSWFGFVWWLIISLNNSLKLKLFTKIIIIILISDVGLLTLNRYILLDPILLCFMMCATYGMTKVGSLHEHPFTFSWWSWLVFTGISLACTISVKFVGLFVVLLVGFYTIYALWRELGNLSQSVVWFNWILEKKNL